MPRRILIINGHPDTARHLDHALADAYAEGARAAGHEVEIIEIALLEIPYLRTQEEFEHGTLPESLTVVRQAMERAEHYVFVFPLWLGTLPAMLKALLEQVMRPGIAFEYQAKGFPKTLLKGRSARIIVTMGMPAFAYRLFYLSHGIKSFERSILKFVGITPVRTTFLGGVVDAPESRRAGWLQQMRELGRAGS